MEQHASALRAYFAKLHLRPEIADMYVALRKHGPQTMSELARHSKVERVQIYRLLDELKASGLIEVEVRYKRNILRAAPIANIQLLILKKEQELKDLQRDFTLLSTRLDETALHSATTRVQFYEGIDGLKQMLWGQTKGKSENLGILYNMMQDDVDLAFFERWVRQCNEQNITFRGIVGDRFATTLQQLTTGHADEHLNHWQSHYVPEHVFPIAHSTVTYDDTVLHYSWNDGRIFGIEIHNADIARVQRQLFELLWKQTEPTNV
jgi:DNA-binding PadR family transcriptional regulator